ncbi:hypothetical protein BDQ17DRAFT_818693 [Cyathus striatus]|nr:hypothetical protein BDQ17DRAFT_818693 [Cyathus striatus]
MLLWTPFPLHGPHVKRLSVSHHFSSFTTRISASSASPQLTKITTKLRAYVQAIEASIISAQLAFEFSSEAMVLSDPTVPQEEWDVTAAGVSREGLKSLASRGAEEVHKTVESLREVKQDIYKIAAATKDNPATVKVPVEPGNPEELTKPLKEVGTDLVANLSLISQFTSNIENLAGWWGAVTEQLSQDNFALRPPGAEEGDGDTYAMWGKMKSDWQTYYNVISATQERYPTLLAASTTAWRAVTTPGSGAPSLASSRSPSPLPTAPNGGRMLRSSKSGGFMRFGSWSKKLQMEAGRNASVERGSTSENNSFREGERQTDPQGGDSSVKREVHAVTGPRLAKRASSALLNGVRKLGCHVCIPS